MRAVEIREDGGFGDLELSRAAGSLGFRAAVHFSVQVKRPCGCSPAHRREARHRLLIPGKA
ncbi:hypothetical protein [Aureimonas pseudogalii]|uniref:AraC-like DNA-binding protein n=1 Tax=Aureimonas pseudogalii TaxID=1744844 RepID=A0A7W6H7S2_9HYPH|nr:hypothetical protein [Aureimonas pseudogalii]MBB4000173.1 AraC-like DNA-binding protein [Aureimonas pseudogalii]